MCQTCLVIRTSCYFDYNKPLRCSRCLVYVSCSVMWSWRTTRAKDHGHFILIEVRKSYDMHNILSFKVVHSSSPLLLLEPSVKSFYPAKCKPWVSSMSFLTLCSSCDLPNEKTRTAQFTFLMLWVSWMVTVGLKVRIVPFRVMRQIKIHEFCY